MGDANGTFYKEWPNYSISLYLITACFIVVHYKETLTRTITETRAAWETKAPDPALTDMDN